MLTTLIVDDERNARARLARLLQSVPGVEVIGEAASGAEAIAKIRGLAPRLVLLDIEMPDLNGIEVVRSLGAGSLPSFIFVTAHEEYAVDAFDVRAVDYLLKPVRVDRLQEAVRRVSEPAGPSDTPREPRRAMPFRRIVARVKDGIRIIPVTRLVSASVEDKTVYVETLDGRFGTDYDLTQLEQSLDPSSFVRVHRQHIAALAHVRELHPLINGVWRLVMNDGREIPVSRSFAPALKGRLER
ncbi:MAG TPA: LytTR family DNA-binding domain-containing protein [Thermoanaerobaculia bacterium]|nr:LytTR family DNA-binding domain-containing protein [Thermoanaerobaculia bacterium]